MTQPPPQQPTWQNPVPPKPKGPKRWPWIVGIVVALFIGIGIGSAGGGSDTKTTATKETTTRTVTSSIPAPAAETVTAPPSTVTYTPPPPPGPKTSFGDGTWRVGKDIQAGSYHTDGGDGCYWEREKDTTGGIDSIAANDNATGPANVTIDPSDAAFKSSNCGTWTLE